MAEYYNVESEFSEIGGAMSKASKDLNLISNKTTLITPGTKKK